MKKLIALALLLSVLLTGCYSSVYAYQATTTYYVEDGDTLWGIACRNSSNSQDIRVVIDIIEEINDCTPDISPGMRLEIPVFTMN